MKTLHIVAGAPASGKSVYGAALAAELKAAFLDIDTATEAVVRAGLHLAGEDPDDRDSPLFKNAFRVPIYESLFAIANENLPHVDVVLAGPFTSELQDPLWLDALKTRFGSPVEIHYLACPPEERRRRLLARNNARDAAKLADWERFLSYYGEEKPPAFEHRLIDAQSQNRDKA